MRSALIVRRLLGFAVRVVAIPALIASFALGVADRPNASTARLTPQPAVVLHELQQHHDLPKGTVLSVGDSAAPITVLYDDRGRLLVTPPKGETFGTILARGYSRLCTLAEQSGARLDTQGTIVATTRTAARPKAQ